MDPRLAHHVVDEGDFIHHLAQRRNRFAQQLAAAAMRVLVVGAGPIGLGVALFARLSGGKVAILDASPERSKAAQDLIGVDDGDLPSIDPRVR